MKALSSTMWAIFSFLLLSFSWVSSPAQAQEDFLKCLSLCAQDSSSISKLIYTPNNSSYSSVLDFTLQNLRFNTTSTPKPLVIVTPTSVSHIQAAIKCSQKHGLQLRVRSGGHDFEGLSYVSAVPFVIVDLIDFANITIEEANKTAWVQAGATMGQVHYRIAQTSRTLAFPGGTWPTVGVGGLFSGGGYGLMLRKYGLAADNVIDAELIDVNGKLLDRSAMGEDLFWAIRGGGGNTFGVVVAWKIKLYDVPATVTVASVQRTLEQNATKLVHQWQYLADTLVDDLFISITIGRVNSSQSSTGAGNTTIQARFLAFYLGGGDSLVRSMQESFPELGLVREDCTEMSWAEALRFSGGFPNTMPLDVAFLQRSSIPKTSFKAKSDYVTKPMPETAFQAIWERYMQEEVGGAAMYMIPYGGKMAEIPESSLPFSHRVGYKYKIQYAVNWRGTEVQTIARHMNWIRELYSYMTPYVSKNPRAAYINYRDLDIGMNNVVGKTSYRQARTWGVKYFNKNFDRLVDIKTKVDPHNFFRNEQSIPPLSPW